MSIPSNNLIPGYCLAPSNHRVQRTFPEEFILKSEDIRYPGLAGGLADLVICRDEGEAACHQGQSLVGTSG